MKRLAEIISEKLSRAKGPIKILVPLRGFSEADQPGGALFEPETDLFFVDQLKAKLNGAIDILEVDYHINDPEFTTLAAETLHSLMVSRLSSGHDPR